MTYRIDTGTSRRVHAPGDVMFSNDELCLYGHLTPEQFHQSAIYAGVWDDDALMPSTENLWHKWYRWTPAQPGDEYSFYAWPAKPKSKGAWPATVLREVPHWRWPREVAREG